jgi:hypothetical protein
MAAYIPVMAPQAIVAGCGAPGIWRKPDGVFPGGAGRPDRSAALVSGAAMDLYFMNISWGFTPC